MCYIDLLHNSAGAFCVWVKELKNKFSTELTYKKRYPAPDTDLEIRGVGGSSRSLDKGGAGLQNLFSALRASVWSKNRGEGPRPPEPLL